MVGATRDQGGHRRTIFNEPKNEMHFSQVVLKLAKELLLYVWIAIDDQKWVLSTARSVSFVPTSDSRPENKESSQMRCRNTSQ